ncbi:MAG TPA: hypothetical protein DD714_00325 [Candidatus Omnitrophica bacterium]|nr:hypothetical protein [Candidatus Omnitrophota bacterium]
MIPETASFVTTLIAGALGVPADHVSEADSMDTMVQWDSLGQLNILTALDKSFAGRVAAIHGLAKATSVRQILDLLRQHGLIA